MSGRKDYHPKIVLFDGYCNLCCFWADFIIKRDKKDLFKVGALQSDEGKALLNEMNLQDKSFDSIVLIENYRWYYKSKAVLRILKNLRTLFKMFYVFIIVPSCVSDIFYDLVARLRYKIFGRRDNCRLPTSEEKKKFISGDELKD